MVCCIKRSKQLTCLLSVFKTNEYKSYCSTVHFRRITSIYQPKNAHIISNKTLLKHFKTLRHVSILSDHHQGALFLAKIILRYSQFNSYLQTRCCGSISSCVGMCCGTVARCACVPLLSWLLKRSRQVAVLAQCSRIQPIP